MVKIQIQHKGQISCLLQLSHCTDDLNEYLSVNCIGPTTLFHCVWQAWATIGLVRKASNRQDSETLDPGLRPESQRVTSCANRLVVTPGPYREDSGKAGIPGGEFAAPGCRRIRDICRWGICGIYATENLQLRNAAVNLQRFAMLALRGIDP